MQTCHEQVTRPFEIYSLSERAVTVQVGEVIDISLLKTIKSLNSLLKQQPFPGMITAVSAYTTLSIFFDPVEVIGAGSLKGLDCFERVCDYIYRLFENEGEGDWKVDPDSLLIPVCFDEEYAPDLAYVADLHKLSPGEAIDLYCSADYKVFMIGFVPGFPYLGGLPEKLYAPRKANPRMKVSSGSVGIAGEQTGVYPLETPGGWQIIGRTPLKFFDPERESPSLLKAGDHVRFYPISSEEFDKLETSL